MIERVDFETAWREARKQLYAVCLRTMHDRALTEEILQNVAVRAWRGYSTFDWKCPIIAWLMTILKNEMVRTFRRRARERVLFEPLDEAALDVPAPTAVEQNELRFGPSIEAAVQYGMLSDQEAQVLAARLAHPEDSWSTIGASLGMLGTTCASIHSRAVPKLRVFLFRKRQSLLGGPTTIRRAFDAACRAGRMRADEMDAFRRIVLEGAALRGDGVRSALRSACAVVVQFLSGSGGLP